MTQPSDRPSDRSSDRPTLEDRLARVLTEATADVTPPQLAGGAWGAARVVRRRRRRVVATAGVGVSAAAVAAVLVLPGVLTAGAGVHRPAQPSDELPASVVQGAVTQTEQVQPSWDPASFATLPRLDLGLPDLRPDPATAVPIEKAPLKRAVAVVKEYGAGGTFYALGEDGRWRSVATDAKPDLVDANAGQPHEPAITGPYLRPGALSADGRYVDLMGLKYHEVYDLAAGRATRVEGQWYSGLWQPDDTLLLKGTPNSVYDPATGALGPATVPLGRPGRPLVAGYAPDGTYVRAQPAPNDPLIVGPTRIKGLQFGDATSLAVGDAGIALETDPRVAGPRGGLVSKGDGLLAVSRRESAVTAFLPIRAQYGYLADIERLVPRLWLDDDTLLFSVRPDHGPGVGTWDTPGGELLVAWNPVTGALQQVAQTTNQWRQVSLASELLTR